MGPMPWVRSTMPFWPKPGQRWPVSASRAMSWALMVEDRIRLLQSGPAGAAAAAWTGATGFAGAGAAALGAEVALAAGTDCAAGAALPAGVAPALAGGATGVAPELTAS